MRNLKIDFDANDVANDPDHAMLTGTVTIYEVDDSLNMLPIGSMRIEKERYLLSRKEAKAGSGLPPLTEMENNILIEVIDAYYAALTGERSINVWAPPEAG
jgi:hypothetical protein